MPAYIGSAVLVHDSVKPMSDYSGIAKNTTATGVKHCNLNTSPRCHQN